MIGRDIADTLAKLRGAGVARANQSSARAIFRGQAASFSGSGSGSSRTARAAADTVPTPPRAV